jgi:predicted nucleotidyltransferase
MEVNPIDKEKIIKVLDALVPEASIYLYGSFARGTAGKYSDYDICLDAGQKIEPFAKYGEASDAINALYLSRKVDVVDYYRISEEMRQAIDRDKVVWKTAKQKSN